MLVYNVRKFSLLKFHIDQSELYKLAIASFCNNGNKSYQLTLEITFLNRKEMIISPIVIR